MSEQANNLESRCVVLVPLNRTDAADLLAQKEDLQITIEHESVLAMAEICLQHQQLRTNRAWDETKPSPNVEQMIDSIQRYLPNTTISELRNGRLESIDNCGSVVDSLEEPPIIQSESIDADELSMLLDEAPQRSEE